jgi:CubicO group peptidase (beta-lactamase class C family)
MLRLSSLALPFAFLLLGAGQLTTVAPPPRPYTTLDNRKLTAALVDAQVQRLMDANKVTGLGIAVIRDGKVVFLRSYGYASLESKAPLTPGTVMYGASLTKATFAWMLMQLVDQGRVNLDTPIEKYLPKPLPDYDMYSDLKGDERWRKLTLRMLMNHSSGFANLRWLEDDKKLRFHREPGARFGYSGEGVRLAQFVLEQGLGFDVAKEMQARIFDRYRMNETSLTWRDDYVGRIAYGYTDTGERQPFAKRSKVDAAGSMDTSLADWSRFLAGVVRGDGMSEAAHAAMIHPTIMIDSPAQFPTLTDAQTNKWKPLKLGYGVGWGTFLSPYGQAFFKEGHDDGTDNYAVCIDTKRSCILLLSNDNRAVNIFVPLINSLLGPIGVPAAWEGYRP